MNHAVCYTRVSTDEQAREGVSLAAQEERLRGYCMMSGLAITTIICEEGVSGRTPVSHRPGGKEMLKLIREKQVQHIVALKLDRLFRDAEDALRQTRQWDEGGIALHLVDMGGTAINTASAMGRLLITMMSGFAELERNLIAERTASALQHKKRHRQVYSPTPYGFQREGALLIPDPEESAVVTRISDLAAGGASLRQIASILNTEGIPSKSGGKWHPSTLWYVLHNNIHG
jgi:DNA invertase Pin-like site-specific DNA recombinase